MKGQCCICTELFISTSDISAAQCGHTFHAVCLKQWLGQAKTCPHCRKRINEKYVVDKLFFDAADESVDDDDETAVLKNKVADLTVQMKEMAFEVSKVTEEKNITEKNMQDLRDSFKTMDQLYRQERSNNSTLKKQLQCHEELQKDASIAKEEAKVLRERLSLLKNVELVVNGSEDDIRHILSSGDSKQLSTWCSVLQKELQTKRQECKELRAKANTLKSESTMNSRLAAQRQNASKDAEKQVEILKEQLQDADNEIIKLKKKINALEKAIGSPSDTLRSFAHRMIHESPAPLITPPMKKPRLTDPEENMMSPDLFNSPATSSCDKVTSPEEMKQEQSKDKPKMQFLITSTTTSRPKLNMGNKAQDISNIHGVHSYNIFTKKTGMGLADSSAIRKGYNGLGGHDKHITPMGNFTAFKQPSQPRKKTKFGPSRTISTKKEPDLPTLHNFLSQN